MSIHGHIALEDQAQHAWWHSRPKRTWSESILPSAEFIESNHESRKEHPDKRVRTVVKKLRKVWKEAETDAEPRLCQPLAFPVLPADDHQLATDHSLLPLMAL